MKHETTAMEVMVFRTNINTVYDMADIKDILDRQKNISRWTVDTDDIDKVLRIEAEGICAEDIRVIITNAGYKCWDL